MDILLTHGYFLSEDPHERQIMKPYPPLGLLYLSAYLKSRGFAVEVFDSTFSDRGSFRRLLASKRPPVVGIYGNLLTRKSVVDLLEICRDSGAFVICGGPEPANYADEYLENGANAVVVGEGELTLEELLTRRRDDPEASLNGIEGVVYQETGETVRNPSRPLIPNLDELPFPDRAAIDIDRYLQTWRRHHGKAAVSVITSRGCPYTCTWCSHGVFGHSHRSRSPSNVAREVELVLSEYQPDLIWYADDVFTINPRWFFAYAEELKRRNLVVPFETISREDRLDEKIIQKLAEMGCYRLWIGCESGSQRILDAMQRRTDASRVPEVVRMLQSRGIQAGLFVMLGYVGEELSDLQETARLLKQARPDVFMSTVSYPIKGTPYFEEVKDRLVTSSSWRDSSDRQIGIAGRHSRRYYEFANRWLVGEVALDRARRRGMGHLLHQVKALASAQIGRLGMRLTRGEVETS